MAEGTVGLVCRQSDHEEQRGVRDQAPEQPDTSVLGFEGVEQFHFSFDFEPIVRLMDHAEMAKLSQNGHIFPLQKTPPADTPGVLVENGRDLYPALLLYKV